MLYNNRGAINGTQLTVLLENWQTVDRKVLAIMSGHTHADKVDTTTNTFAHISIGTQYPNTVATVPVDATSPIRQIGTVTQDLWDIMVIKLESKEIKLIRFGAGEDRTIVY